MNPFKPGDLCRLKQSISLCGDRGNSGRLKKGLIFEVVSLESSSYVICKHPAFEKLSLYILDLRKLSPLEALAAQA